MIRLLRAFFYSINGLKMCFLQEFSFRIEVVLFCIFSAILPFLPFPYLAKLHLVSCFFLILICELFNSGIEKLSDRITSQQDPFIKYAKDVGSAAVFLSILLTIITLIYYFFNT